MINEGEVKRGMKGTKGEWMGILWMMISQLESSTVVGEDVCAASHMTSLLWPGKRRILPAYG